MRSWCLTRARFENVAHTINSSRRRGFIIKWSKCFNRHTYRREDMDTSTLFSRLQFAFTISYHYLFPQFTMGLALLLLILKSLYLWRKNEIYNSSARFWAKILAISFIMGVVTGSPLEFQLGTNWARFSAYAGDIIAQTLAME